jgi:hypothetical protein
MYVCVYGNPSRSMRTGGRTTDRRTSMTKLIVAFWKFPNAPKNACTFHLNTTYNWTETWRWYLAISIAEFVDFISLSLLWKSTPYRKWSPFQPEAKIGKVPSQVLSSERDNLNYRILPDITGYYWILLARFEDNNKTCRKEIRWRMWNRFIRLRMETSGGLFWTEPETSGFHYKWGNS